MDRLDAFSQSYRDFFKSGTRSVANSAIAFLRGLFVAERSNMQQISESIDNTEHQNLQYLLSEAKWDFRDVQQKIARDADAILGGHEDSVLIIDESGFSKKGECSAGVRRQWNGRMGKVDNCQVGVFSALSRGIGVALIGAKLYLPKEWTESKRKCDKAKIPNDERTFKSKAQIGLDMIRKARADGVRFSWVGADAGYGKDPAFLRSIDDMGERFLVDVHASQRIYLEDPGPAIQNRSSTKGRSSKSTDPAQRAIRVDAWMSAMPASAWNSIQVRHSTLGPIQVQAMHRRVWLWDGVELAPRRWTLLIVRNPSDSTDIHYALTNANAEASLETIVRIERQRFWIEHALGDAKSEVGLGHYEVRTWVGWHRHMTLCMMATLFSLGERYRVVEEIPMLSSRDVRCIIADLITHPEQDREAIYRTVANRQLQRWKSTRLRYEIDGFEPYCNALARSTM